MATRKGSKQVVKGRLYGRFWLGGEKRESIRMPGVDASDEASVQARCEVIADVAGRCLQAGRPDKARDFAILLGEARTDKSVATILKGVERFMTAEPTKTSNVTVQAFGERWTNGTLAAEFPDYVKVKRSKRDDEGILKRYIYPLYGSMPIAAFRLADAERVMAHVPSGRSSARRRHVAQVLAKLLKLAVYPAKILPAYPLPPGFLPKLGPGKAKQYLYPDEDRALMGCTEVPLACRILYGVMAREGLRLSEALLLEWTDLDLARGVIRLDENKTSDPRSWVLDDNVRRVLQAWKDSGGAGPQPFSKVKASHAAERFREEHLKLAGVDRPELFLKTDARKPICVHDLRATFVTISLANGKTETWVQDRTGHRSTLMIARYRRAARTIAELKLGPLLPLYDVLDWCEECQTSVKRNGGNGSVSSEREMKMLSENNVVTPSGVEPERPIGTADFKTDQANRRSEKRSGNRRTRCTGVPAELPFDSGLTRGATPAFDTYIVLDAVREAVENDATEDIARAFDRGVQKALARDEAGTIAELHVIGERRGWR